MASNAGPMHLTRRKVLRAVGLGGIALAAPRVVRSADAEAELVAEVFRRMPVASDRLRLEIPRHFANGYTVPLALEVDCPMSEADHVRAVHVLAPHNPFLRVASFHFTPLSGRAVVSTRIRLAEPQNVIAVADMSDGSLTMAKTWVEVEINGCDTS